MKTSLTETRNASTAGMSSRTTPPAQVPHSYEHYLSVFEDWIDSRTLNENGNNAGEEAVEDERSQQDVPAEVTAA